MHQHHAMLQAGQPAPQFSLPDSDMEPVSLARFRGKKNVVLYFYPRDGTPGCILQATDFSDHEDEFARHECVVVGIGPDDCLSHAEFRDANGISIQLLSDTDRRVCEKYGVLRDDQAAGAGAGAGNRQGKSTITRTTFVIDKKGIIQHAIYNTNPRGHALDVLDLVRTTFR